LNQIKTFGNSSNIDVTIITVVRNHEAGLISTMKSVTSQVYKNWNSIIVVGESGDNTLEVARKYSSKNSNVQVVEQSGTGIYQAMNEGSKMVTSKYLWYMNAGDQFHDEFSLQTAVKESEEMSLDLLIGGHRIENSRNSKGYSFPAKVITPFKFSINRRFGCHQSMLFLASTVKELGYYDTNYKIVADFDLVMRICKTGLVKRTPSMMAIIEPGGGADQNIIFVHHEKQKVRKALLESRLQVFIGEVWTLLAILKIKWKKTINNMVKGH
jgi:glycosyltransferase involved in cell wall biosynthesis